MGLAGETIVVAPLVVQAIYGVSCLTSVLLGYVVWTHREKTGARPLLVMILGGFAWGTTLFVNTLVADFETSSLLVRLNYVGVVVAVFGIFLFGLVYTGREHLVTRRTVALLSIEPAIVVPLALFNPGNVFFESVYPAPDRAIGVWTEFGIGFYLHTLYSYALILAASAMVIGLVYRTQAMYRGQLLALVGAVTLPIVPNLLGIAEVVNFDATPIGFLIADTLFTVAITRYRLIDLAPIARDRVVNTINDAVYVVDTDHRIIDVNTAGERLATASFGDVDLIGADARDVLAPAPGVASLYHDVVAAEGEGERTIGYEVDGTHFHLEAVRIEDAMGRAVGRLFVVRDITDQKRRETELRERNEQLDRFASVVSHDLRNPLQVASGRVELARETADADQLADAEAALARMETIIQDVLSLARQGTEVTDATPVSLREAAETAWESVELRDAALAVDADVQVTADRDRLVRLLENLFRNALEHGLDDEPSTDGDGSAGSDSPGLEVRDLDTGDPRAGGPAHLPASRRPPARLTVTVGPIERDGRLVGFYVADDGTGIPDDERETVFESGFTTSAAGTGFGLTIVSQIAEVHDWQVRATESEDGGARFEFTDVEVSDP